jgi:hypothetical protein
MTKKEALERSIAMKRMAERLRKINRDPQHSFEVRYKAIVLAEAAEEFEVSFRKTAEVDD